jgi:uncharacterized lipoprotein YddW (UPF0748 family)
MSYIYVQSKSCRTQPNAEKILQGTLAAGIKTILYNVTQGGAHFNSAYWPRCPSIAAGFDPLGFLITRGKELGISVYAWVTPGAEYGFMDAAWNISKLAGVPAGLNWLNFGIPEARQTLANVYGDIVNKYPVAGIVLDYIRYTTTSAWNPPTPPFMEEDITAAVKLISQTINRRAKLVAAVRGSDYLKVKQNWPLWIRQGLVDAVLPMIYEDDVPHLLTAFAAMAKGNTDISLNKYIVTLGLQSYPPPTYAGVDKPDAALQTQIAQSHLSGFKVLSYFDYGALSATKTQLIKKDNTMPIVTDLTNVANDVETQANSLGAIATTLATLSAQAASINAQATDLLAQVATIRKAITDLGTANGLADQLANLL